MLFYIMLEDFKIMRLKVEEINIERITRHQAQELMNEMIKSGLRDKMLFGKGDEYPRTKELFELLNASFDSCRVGVHITKDGKQ